MASLKRLERAIAQMTTTNIRANQAAIGDFNELLNAGRYNLEESFRSTLAESAKPVEPLHYITKGERSARLNFQREQANSVRPSFSQHLTGANLTLGSDGQSHFFPKRS